MSRIASCAILGKGHSDDPLPCSQAVLPVFRLELELRVQARAARGQGFWIALYGEEFTIKMIFRKFSFQPELRNPLDASPNLHPACNAVAWPPSHVACWLIARPRRSVVRRTHALDAPSRFACGAWAAVGSSSWQAHGVRATDDSCGTTTRAERQ